MHSTKEEMGFLAEKARAEPGPMCWNLTGMANVLESDGDSSGKEFLHLDLHWVV